MSSHSTLGRSSKTRKLFQAESLSNALQQWRVRKARRVLRMYPEGAPVLEPTLKFVLRASEAQRELRSLARCGSYCYRASVLAHNLAYDGEAESSAVRSFGTDKRLEDFLLIGKRNAGTGVGHFDGLR